MNKQLLFATVLLSGSLAFSQGHRKAALYQPVKTGSEAVVNEPLFAPSSHKAGPVNAPHPAAICNPVTPFSSSINAFAVGGGVTTYQQNCLSYNKDLNTLLWTSRVSQDWSFTGKTSGSIQATWMDIATGLWDSMIIYRDSSNDRPARYPGGVLFNPAGNSVISGARMVGSGAATSKTGTPAWKGVWYAYRQPTGNYHATNIVNQLYFDSVGKAPFGYVGNSATNVGFLNLDMCQTGNTVRVGGALFDPSSGEVIGGVIARGTYSGGNFTWDRDTIDANFLSNAGGRMSDGLGPRIAFDPSGMIGYAVFNGRLAGTYSNSSDSTMMPIVFKTIDGGTTWTGPILPGYDWSNNHPELLKNVGLLQFANGARHVTPWYMHGTDVTVDANGVLHYVTTLTCPYQDGVSTTGFDSLQFTYNYKWDYWYNHPIIWDLMTDGTCWKTMMVDSVLTSSVGSSTSDTTTVFNPWENVSGTSWLPYGARIGVSRSTDGKFIFYGWADSDSTITGTRFNSNPDLWAKAYDIDHMKVSPTVNLTNGAAQCYFHYISDVSYLDPTANKWVVPYVYTLGRVSGTAPGSYAGTGPVDYYYGICPTFDASNVNLPAMINNDPTACAIGVQSHNNYEVAVNAYPNPFNHSTTIAVHLNEARSIDLKVFDAVGNLVFSKKVNGNPGENSIHFDGSSLAAGVYHYTIAAGMEKVTKKLVIQK